MDDFFLKFIFILLILLSVLYGCKSYTKNINASNIKKSKKIIKNNYVLSSRFFHPRNSKDPHSTINTIAKLNPKRIDWIYYSSKKVLKLYQDYKLPYSLALNPQTPDSLGYTTRPFRIIEFTGDLYKAPWMKKWKIKNPHWGCVNNPKFNKVFLAKALYLCSLKPYALFVDDALFNARLKLDKKIGCFCKHCKLSFNKKYKTFSVFEKNLDSIKLMLSKEQIKYAKKSKHLRDFISKYEEHQEESVVLFLERWKTEVKKKYHKVRFLTNNYNGKWNPIYKVFDGGISELDEKYINVKDLDSIYAIADSLNKSQLFSIASSNYEIQKSLLKYNAKNNRESLYPWDIFISGKKRYYMPIDSILKIKKELKKN